MTLEVISVTSIMLLKIRCSIRYAPPVASSINC